MSNIKSTKIEELQNDYIYHFKSLIHLSQLFLCASLFILILMYVKSPSWLLYLNMGTAACFLMACLLSVMTNVETQHGKF